MVLGSEIRDPVKTYSGSRIQGSKRHRIPDPGSATLKSIQMHITIPLGNSYPYFSIQ
jgi:hypothetical protein